MSHDLLSTSVLPLRRCTQSVVWPPCSVGSSLRSCAPSWQMLLPLPCTRPPDEPWTEARACSHRKQPGLAVTAMLLGTSKVKPPIFRSGIGLVTDSSLGVAEHHSRL